LRTDVDRHSITQTDLLQFLRGGGDELGNARHHAGGCDDGRRIGPCGV
jgi:hypothetical protein